MYICTYVDMSYLSIYVYLYVYIFTCVYIYIYVYICANISECKPIYAINLYISSNIDIYINRSVDIYVYLNICICRFIYFEEYV